MIYYLKCKLKRHIWPTSLTHNKASFSPYTVITRQQQHDYKLKPHPSRNMIIIRYWLLSCTFLFCGCVSFLGTIKVSTHHLLYFTADRNCLMKPPRWRSRRCHLSSTPLSPSLSPHLPAEYYRPQLTSTFRSSFFLWKRRRSTSR